MQKKVHSKPPMDKKERRRGRPAGKNRAPLSLVERRARNAQYERERRIETADAMAQLAEAACCDPKITNSDLLATVISRLQRATNKKSSESIEDLKRVNDNLESQITALQSRLESNSDLQENELHTNSDGRKSSPLESDSDAARSDERPAKYRKTARNNTLHDNAQTARRSISQPNSSSDSQDSVWSNHQLGKTVPSQEVRPTTVKVELDDDSTSMSSSQTTEPSSDWRQSTTSSESEFYSEASNQSEAHSEETESQQEVKVEFSLVPEQGENNSVDDQSNVNFVDPFTDREKAILERLGCSDFINFDNIYTDDQANLVWPLDYTGY